MNCLWHFLLQKLLDDWKSRKERKFALFLRVNTSSCIFTISISIFILCIFISIPVFELYLFLFLFLSQYQENGKFINILESKSRNRCFKYYKKNTTNCEFVHFLLLSIPPSSCNNKYYYFVAGFNGYFMYVTQIR